MLMKCPFFWDVTPCAFVYWYSLCEVDIFHFRVIQGRPSLAWFRREENVLMFCLNNCNCLQALCKVSAAALVATSHHVTCSLC
jgi:hypothetical protein